MTMREAKVRKTKNRNAPGIKKKSGFGNPPEEHRFAKGKSGNPGGRPKKKSDDVNDVVFERLNSKLTPASDSILVLIINCRIRSALKGSDRAAEDLLDRYDIAKRQRGKAANDDQTDLEAARRIFDLDPRFYTEVVGDDDPSNGNPASQQGSPPDEGGNDDEP